MTFGPSTSGAAAKGVGAWLNRRPRPRPANVRLWAMRTGVPYEWLRYGTWPEDQIKESEQVKK
jgi:hypothetical protein